MSPRAPLRLTGALVLRPEGLVEDALTLEDGRIAHGGGAEADLGGFWLLPGIVDLHGDAFERHMAPRSGVGFDMALGLASVDAELCANGVTTAYLAQCFSWEGGKRGADCAEALLAARAGYAARADMRVQLRYETHFVEGAERLAAAVRSGAVGYVVFNNHVPDALALWERSPEIVAAWAGESRRSAAEHMAVVEAAAARAPEAPASVARIAKALREAGALMGSHDDPDAETRARFDALGAHVCEFPTTREAAAAAKARGNPVLMGAPNVVRGGSQSGNVSAEALVAEGLCDVLVSDYYYPAMAAAVWALAERGTLGFAEGWALVSENPARVLQVADRGVLREGARADVVAMNPATRRIEAVFVEGRPVHLAGEAAERLIGRREAMGRVAAE